MIRIVSLILVVIVFVSGCCYTLYKVVVTHVVYIVSEFKVAAIRWLLYNVSGRFYYTLYRVITQ